MPLTLCHSNLLDTDVAHCELENRHLVHPSFEQQRAGRHLAFEITAC